ncbi:hypothetical protein C7122_03710 [Lachnospiraceae bacterium oral taxon 096]|nr:hypothetical protein C7122_03710 [Lachnospiraceae bacterium oral taxon 096]QUI95660.1 hypothetical protein J5A74_09855 [Lachnospiraceae bacterium oral taxon 096]
MKVAPIIHSRTLNCDFNAEFLVRPERFNSDNIKWARENILKATEDIDSLQGFRWLIVDNGKYRLAGVVGFLEDICCEAKGEKGKFEKFFLDNRGRRTFAFVGVVIDKEDNNEYGDIDISTLWEVYVKEVENIWEKKHQGSESSKFKEIQVNSDSVAKSDIEKYLEANSKLDKEEFARLMCDGKRENFSFCSNITSWKLVEEGAFDYVTTKSNNIERITKEKKGGEKREESIDVCSNDDRESTDERKKKVKKQNIILVVISVIFCLVLVLMLKMDTY